MGVRKYYLSGRKLVTIYTSVLLLLFKNILYFNIKITTNGYLFVINSHFFMNLTMRMWDYTYNSDSVLHIHRLLYKMYLYIEVMFGIINKVKNLLEENYA